MKRRTFLGGLLAAALWPRRGLVVAAPTLPPVVPPVPAAVAPLTFGGIPIIADAQCRVDMIYGLNLDGIDWAEPRDDPEEPWT